jgi:hypothetical protein
MSEAITVVFDPKEKLRPALYLKENQISAAIELLARNSMSYLLEKNLPFNSRQIQRARDILYKNVDRKLAGDISFARY